MERRTLICQRLFLTLNVILLACKPPVTSSQQDAFRLEAIADRMVLHQEAVRQFLFNCEGANAKAGVYFIATVFERRIYVVFSLHSLACYVKPIILYLSVDDFRTICPMFSFRWIICFVYLFTVVFSSMSLECGKPIAQILLCDHAVSLWKINTVHRHAEKFRNMNCSLLHWKNVFQKLQKSLLTFNLEGTAEIMRKWNPERFYIKKRMATWNEEWICLAI